jgi:hypothetical protein
MDDKQKSKLNEDGWQSLNDQLKLKIKKDIIKLLKSTKRENIISLIKYLNESDFFIAPASTKYHGVFESGLAFHSIRVYEIYRSLRAKYNYSNDLRDTEIICGLLHDVCKIGLYKLSDSGFYEYDDLHPGGHGILSICRIKEHIKLTELEQKIIGFHMSYYYCDEFRNDGEYTMEQLAKAQNDPDVLLFYFADHLATVSGS